jgi:hypothetical protein
MHRGAARGGIRANQMPSASTDLAAALGAVLDAFGQLLRVRKPKIYALARQRMYPVRRIPAPRLGTVP